MPYIDDPIIAAFEKKYPYYMELWQSRVIDEKEELDLRIMKLECFIDTVEFAQLDRAERDRLLAQRKHMRAYLRVLEERTLAF